MSRNGNHSPDKPSSTKTLWHSIRGDGCSQVPDWHKDYTECCNRHDADYRSGTDQNGNPLTRSQADSRLYDCMKKQSRTLAGRLFVSPLYYLGVRVFGSSHFKGKEK